MNSSLHPPLFLLLLATKAFSLSPCTTEKNLVKDQQQTSCSYLGLTTVPLAQIPYDTAILLLNFNAFSSVSTSSFKGLLHLETLDLSSNALSIFNTDFPLDLVDLNLANNSFDHLPLLSPLSNLNKLDLSTNRIRSLPDSAFRGLKNLKELDLRRNKIGTLSEQVFEDQTALEILNLAFNELRSVPRHLISDSTELGKFYMTGNRLTEIPDNFFEGLDHLSYVYLDQNPWHCNCALEYFKTWLEDNAANIYITNGSLTVGDEYSVVCSSPRGVPLLDYSMDHCKKSADKDHATFVALEVTTVPMTAMTTTTEIRLTTEEAGTSIGTVLVSTTKVTVPATTRSRITTIKEEPTATVAPTSKMVRAATTLGTTTTVMKQPITTVVKPLKMTVPTTTHGPATANVAPITTMAYTLKIVLPTTTHGTTTMKPSLPPPLFLLATKAFSPSPCTTEKNITKDQRQTSCSNLGLTTVPLTHIPNDTAILLLNFNAFSSVSTSSFKSLLHLVELDLSSNALSIFNTDYPLALVDLNLANNSFDRLPLLSPLSNLNRLDLSNNRIGSLPDSAFRGLKNLTELDLRRNKIGTLSEQVFEDQTALDTLNLAFNELRNVPRRLISTATKLGKLYMTGNRLTEIPEDFFQGLDHLVYVYLDRNPWHCSCAVDYFKTWLEDNAANIYITNGSLTVGDEYSVVCSSPRGVPLLNYSMDHCRKPAVKGLATLEVTTVPMTAVTPTTEISRTTGRTTEEATELGETSIGIVLVSTTEVTVRATTRSRATTIKDEPVATVAPVAYTLKPALVTTPRERMEEPLLTEPPTETSVALVAQGAWLADAIVRHCCSLHLLLYLLSLLLLLPAVAATAWLAWTYVHEYRLYHTRPPAVRLVRYSLVVQWREEELLRGNKSKWRSHFRGQWPGGATPMLMLEAESGEPVKKYISAII